MKKGKEDTEKLLKDFLKKGSSLEKRWKSFNAFRDAASPDELGKACQDNFNLIFMLLQDAVADFSALAAKNKRDPVYMDAIVALLQTITRHLSDLIGRQWQTKALLGIICNLLYRQNKLELRLRGLDIYMAFVTSVKMREEDWTAQKDVVAVFGQSLLFQPFVPAGATVKFAFHALEAPNDVAPWMPGGTGAPTVDDAEQLLKRALDFIGKQNGADFSVWFRMLCVNVFSVAFPKVCQQMGLLPADQNTGFAECPPRLLRLLVGALEGFMRDAKKAALIWADSQNAQVLLEMYSQGMGVGTAESDISVSVLNVFHPLFFPASGTLLSEIAPRIGPFRVYYLKRILLVFSKATDPGSLAQHVKLCQEALRVLNLCSAAASTFDKPALDLVLAIPLNGLASVFNNVPVAEQMVRELTLTSIKRWIIVQPDTLWKPLDGVIQVAIGQSNQAVEALLEMVMQMTLVLQRFYYPSRTVKESKRQLGAAGQATAGHFSRSPDYRILRDPPEPDPEVFGLASWNAKTALQVWVNVKNLFGGLNTISDPVRHAKATEALACVVDYLVQQEAGIPLESLSQPDQPRPLELLDQFGALLCETLECGDDRMAGRATAAGALCRLFCRQTDQVPLVVLQFVYSVIAKELEERPCSLTTFEIIANCGPFFSLALPGAHGMIPYFMHAIKMIVDSKAVTEVPDGCLRNCITIVCSLICFPSHFPKLAPPVSMNTFALPLKTRGVMKAEDLLEHVNLLLAKLQAFVTKSEHVFMVMCGLTVSVMSESRSGLNGQGHAAKWLTNIIQRASNPDPDVAVGALHCLASLAMDLVSISKYDANLITLTLSGISNMVIDVISTFESDKKAQMCVPAVVAAFEVLEEWALVVPSSVVGNPTVNKALFTAIELGIFGTKMSSSADKAVSGKKKVRETVAGAAGEKLEEEGFSALRAKPSHGSREISEAAEVLLRSMLNLHAQWPGPGGPEMTGTSLREISDPDKEDDTNHVYFFANGSIVSLIPSADRAVRMIVRDETDRFAWDARVMFDDESVIKSLQPLPAPSWTAASPSRGGAPDGKSKQRPLKEPPAWHGDEDSSKGDKVEELLKYLGEVYDDCQYEADTIQVADEIKPLVEETARLMDKQQETMEAAARTTERNSEALPLMAANAPTEPAHWSRLLLSHFNMVDYDQRAMFAMLESGTPLQRSINTLDTKRAREAFKVGVIYVRKGQDTQEQILRNETRSQYYDAFVRSLAWEVNMATHRGYNGGLDVTKFLTGTSAPYYATARIELMLHEITAMPTDHKDDQQIHKKRHVGNDVVNIVFSENTRDYDPATISTQFNCAHLIVYPHANSTGLYRIQICRKEEQVYPLFGPLLHNMCVSAEILPLLVRQTSLNANRNFTSHKAGYLMPFQNRSKDVVQLLSRYKQDNKDYSQTLTAAFARQA